MRNSRIQCDRFSLFFFLLVKWTLCPKASCVRESEELIGAKLHNTIICKKINSYSPTEPPPTQCSVHASSTNEGKEGKIKERRRCVALEIIANTFYAVLTLSKKKDPSTRETFLQQVSATQKKRGMQPNSTDKLTKKEKQSTVCRDKIK